VPATVAFHIQCALVAGAKYAVAAIVAGLIRVHGRDVLTATARAKTLGADGARQETTAPHRATGPANWPGLQSRG
jgi:hypothetical protein